MRHDDLYSQIVDGLRLAAAPFEIQTSILPDFVHVPDEIIMGVDAGDVELLVESGRLTQAQGEALADYDRYLATGEISESYPEALADVESGEWFEALRRRARAVLELLGEDVEAPTLRGAIYVGSSEPESP